jgi:hypothetical protein
VLYTRAMPAPRAVVPSLLGLSLLLVAAVRAEAEAPRPRLRTEAVFIDRQREVALDSIAVGELSKVLYLNRCTGGCTLTPGANDARTNESSIVRGTSTVSEFAGTEEQFQQVVDCVKELYSPYDVDIVTADPGSQTFHHEAIVAGVPAEVGLEGNVGGIAPAACDPLNNMISFSFANIDPSDIETVCWTVAQESAHSFGLPNHSFDCSDPMTYLGPDTGDICGRKYFRDKVLPCGEFTALPCKCDVSGQNSHLQLMTVFGPGTPPAPSTVDIRLPLADAAVEDGFDIFFFASNPRQVDKVELVINGTSYATQEGHPFAMRSQTYTFAAPTLPDGYLDIEIRAYDDLGTVGSSTVTVLKGEACVAPADCFEFQECSDGRCAYPEATGELGDECDFEQFCTEGSCVAHEGVSRCAKACNPNVSGSCIDGFECVGTGVCFPAEAAGGCCSVAGAKKGAGALPFLTLGLFGALVLVLRRRGQAPRQN